MVSRLLNTSQFEYENCACVNETFTALGVGRRFISPLTTYWGASHSRLGRKRRNRYRWLQGLLHLFSRKQFYNTSGLESGPSSTLSFTTSGATTVPPPTTEPNPVAPTITADPVSQTLGVGNPLQLSVAATGSQPFTYRWYKDFVYLPAVTGPTFQKTSVSSTDGGYYFVSVSNSVNVAVSRVATIKITQLTDVAPTITVGPASQNLSAGTSLLLTIQAAGSSPLQFQWFRNASPIPGATGTSFQIPSVQTADAGSYTVSISNSVASITSAPAVITVTPPTSSVIAPSITSQPASKTVPLGTALSFTVSAAGTAPFSYQWMKNGVTIVGATAATFQIPDAQAGDAGSYSVQVSNSAGTVTSSAAQLTVLLPPTITQQPVGQSVLSGTRVDFTAQASGSAPLQFQWYRDGILLAGATSTTFSLPSASLTDAGSYTVAVSNGAGSTTSLPAQLSVSPPPVVDAPSITVQPISQSVMPGSTVTFSVQANGSAPLSYQWFLNGNPVLGAVSSTLTLTGVQSANAGSYSVNVSNSAGTAKSSTAILTITGPPNITLQPQSQTLSVGSSLDITVQAAGTPPLQYQWFRNGVAISLATSSIYHVSSIRSTDAGSYSVNVSNGSGSVASTEAVITVIAPPTITTQPTGQNVNVGSSFALSVVAAGVGPLTYQWFHNGTAIPNGTAATFQVSAAQQADAGQYYVTVSNSAGSVTSLTVNVTVNVPIVAPVITTPPATQTVTLGSSITLSVQVTGTAPLQFQWFRNGTPLQNGTASTFQIASAQATDAGNYAVNVANAAGSVSSTPVFITVLTPPVITQQPQSKSAVSGSPASFTVTSSGSTPLSYQWLKNGLSLPGQTAATLNIASTQLSDAGNYSVSISNAAGTTTSSIASLTVTAAPTSPSISNQPIGQAIASGTAINLSVTATGTAPLLYQWFRNGIPLANAQSATLQIPNAQATDSGSYSVSISNTAGSLVSAGAVVTVLEVPQIVVQPQSKSLTTDSPLSLAVTASGSPPLSYQWFKNAALLSGATGAILDLGAADAGESGNYYVRVSNGIGSTNSAVAVVTVTAALVPAGISVQPFDQIVASGKPLTLSVVATGSTPLQYQWFRNGVAIQNANADNFRIDVPRTTDSAIYTVKVSNTAGTATSTPATITVLDAPVITQQPQSKSVTVGMALNIGATVSGSTPLTYQWFKDDLLLPGATGATLDLGAAEFSEAGRYYVSVSNPIGSTNSATATVLVTAAPVAAGISVQPLDQTLASGTSLILSVVATGSTPIQYQWLRNGVAIQNANANTFQIDATKTTDSALYTVKVSNSAGSVTSAAALVTILDPPIITQQPQTRSVTIGSPLSLAVAASGSAPLTYQWFKNDALLAGATSATLDLGTATSAAAGDYYVKITNPVASTNSTHASVMVTAAPVPAAISVQPLDQTIASGTPLILWVQATGSTPIQYQWFRNGVPIANASANTFRIDAPQTSDAAIYTVKVSNSAGSTTSTPALISVLDPVVITQQPQSKSVTVGSLLSLTTTAVGSSPLSYQWFKNGVPVPSATSAILDLGAADSPEAGDYYVRISNPVSNVNSAVASVSITALPVAPTISLQPLDQVAPTGQPLVLSVIATGSTPLQYQWFRNGNAIQNANTDTFTIGTPKTSDSAIYSVKVSNSAGSATSSTAAITFLDPLSITQQPQSRSVTVGSALGLSVAASGSAPLTYQWYKDGTALPGATSAILDLGFAESAEAGNYYTSISNPIGTINSAAATVTITTAPVSPGISVQPLDQTVASGLPLILSVQATGSTPLQYQWFRNGIAIQNANLDTFTIVAPKTSDSAIYSVKVSNSVGSLSSANAAITVLDPIVISQQPQSRTVTMGAPLGLAAVASGSAPLSYQWYKDAVLLPGATSATLDLGSADLAEAGSYYVTISNPIGSTNSAFATVLVTEVPVAPSITLQPTDQTAPSGQPLTLSVAATGSNPLQYQWFRNGAAIQNANLARFTIVAPKTSDSAIYAVKVSNSAGSVNSANATITVLDPILITQQPSSKSVIVGSPLDIAVSASGSAPLSYQWFKDGALLPGATSATLDLGVAQSSRAGDYYVTISNPVGTTNSAVATVQVTAVPVAPSILVQPTDQTAPSGMPLTLSVVALGSAPLQYQWFRNGAPIQNATSDSFSIQVPETSDSALYTVKISNSVGSVTSASAVITVLDPLVITQQPEPQSVAQGAALSLSVAATGSAPVNYQWFKDGAPLSGGTSAVLDLGAAQSVESGEYYVKISNPVGTTNSSTATVAVMGPVVSPTITVQPIDQTVSSSSALTLSVTATGSAPLQYQWFRNGSPLPGANANTYQLASPRTTDSGKYSVTISNSAGSASSRSAVITVLDAPIISVQPQSKSVIAGSPLSLAVAATGSAPLSYQWLRSGVPIGGANSATLNLGSAQAADSGEYSVKVSNSIGSVSSSSATIAVTSSAVAPAINVQPFNQTVAPGGAATFSVQATGTSPLQYQWYRNGVAIPTATSALFVISGVQQNDAATYTVNVSNTAGAATSNPASLTIDASLAAPIITVQPLGQNLTDSSPLTLSVQAVGANLAYQWFHDGVPIPAGTAASYYVASIQSSDAGAYNVRVSNNAGTVTSITVNVTVTTRPTAPTLVKAPVSQTVTLGTPVTLSVQATGSAPLQYQWSRNGRPLANGTSQTLQIVAAQAADAGDYSVNVANAGGSVSTDPVTITVILPPVITQQPASIAVSTGDSLTLSVLASSQSALTYQWYRNGVAVPGATSSTLQITSIQKSQAGGYLVRISNAAGTVNSSVANVTVTDPTAIPTILSQPVGQGLAVGSSLTLSVQASGTGPLTYQWYRNAVAIQNAKGAVYQKPAVGIADAASYTVTISNTAGSVTSSPAVITVLDPPVITTAPKSQTVGQGSSINLTVQATGAPTLTYRWFKNGAPLSAANSASYLIPSASTSDGGLYTVQVTNGDGSVTSLPATITVVGVNGPTIVTQPASQTVLAGADCTFIVEASGTGLQYQWFFNGAPLTEATNALLRLMAIDSAEAGDYTVTVSNSAGSVDSAAATLTINSPPLFTRQPTSQTVNAGSALTLSAIVSGSNPLRYQWLRDGFAVSGATNATLQIPSARSTDGGTYVLRVSNDLGSITSQQAVVIVLLPPSIISQPTSQTLTLGKPVTFAVQAMGVGQLQYQWFVNGSAIPNATGASFQIASAQSSDAGIYTVQISNAAGSVTSDPAILGTSIANQFAIAKQPLSQVLAVGSTLNLSVQITGGVALQYQWFRNGIAIGGGTSPNLKIGSLQTSDAGSYALRITSTAGILMSDPAVVRVVIPPGILVQPASQNVTAGSLVTLLVQASGSGPLQYQWSRDQIPLANATAATLKIVSAQASDAGVYSVKVFNEAGSITSQDAVVSILVPPSITKAPASRSIAPGAGLDLGVQATGSAPLLYQWFRNGVVIPNATASTLHFDAVSPSDSASYAVSVANPAGMVMSEPAVLSVIAAPTITAPPQRQVLPVGAPLLLTVGYTGINPQFQWFRDAFPLPGATNSILEIPELNFEDQGAYRVTVANEAGSTTSSPALVVVLAPPSILTQPHSLNLNQGATANFFVLADGSDPLSYQWFRNGLIIPGATDSSYTFSASTNNAGSYHVEITNPLGTVSSFEVTLTVSNGDSVTPPAEPRVEITYAADADLVLQTIGAPGTVYDLQSSDQVPPTEWITVSSATAGSDGVVSFTATNPKVDSKFYRVVIHEP